MAFLESPIEFLKGVGTQRAELLKSELGIQTFGDLLFHFPFRYVDRSQFHRITDIIPNTATIQLRGRISGVRMVGEKKARRLIADFQDASGKLELIWFKGINWIKDSIKSNEEFVVFGKPTLYQSKLNIAHPEVEPFESYNKKLTSFLQPIYGTTEKLTAKGLNSRGLEKLINNLLPQIGGRVSEVLCASTLRDLALCSREEALLAIHAPQNMADVQKSTYRLKFEELFFLQLQLVRRKEFQSRTIAGYVFGRVGELFNQFYNDKLPFELTGAQKRVLKEIRLDMGKGKHMNRLLQGDVGSGKTVVALLSMLIACDNGFQASIMAPTEILAVQHYQTIANMVEGMNISVALLTGSTTTAVRRQLHAELQSGQLNILIGTHALIEDKVKYKNLGLVIIDEQHRFGVEQRARLWRKNTLPPHVLVMTATPIPRTLAMTFYGDLDVSTIDEMPPGRKEIQTFHRYDSSRLKLFGFMEEQIKLGRQIYVVYPLIQESETLDYKDLMDGFESIRRRFPLPEFTIGIVHGQMKPADKDYEMDLFASGKSNILVATTVIEVGVNVPNASVMVVESAERFGLSQLHQLRGRVGRGADQSYCILMTSHKLSSDAKHRLATMVRTTDGFEIAEADLKLRGPGDLMGTQQSGLLDLKLADLAKDGQILTLARNAALNIVGADPELNLPENSMVAAQLNELIRSKPNWSRIS